MVGSVEKKMKCSSDIGVILLMAMIGNLIVSALLLNFTSVRLASPFSRVIFFREKYKLFHRKKGGF